MGILSSSSIFVMTGAHFKEVQETKIASSFPGFDFLCTGFCEMLKDSRSSVSGIKN